MTDASDQELTAEEFWSKLVPGRAIGTYYGEEDGVWHEFMALFPGAYGGYYCQSPDGDRYEEYLKCDGGTCTKAFLCTDVGGPPSIARGNFYRFGDYPDDRVFKEWVMSARKECHDECKKKGIDVPDDPVKVITMAAEVKDFAAFFGLSAVAPVAAAARRPIRRPGGSRVGAAAAAPKAGAGPGGRAPDGDWVLCDAVAGHCMGEVIELKARADGQVDTSAVAMLGDMAVIDLKEHGMYPGSGPEFAHVRRVKDTSTVEMKAVYERLKASTEELRTVVGEPPPATVKSESKEEMRTLAVHFDKHGERSRTFREAVYDLVEDSFDDWPLEPVRTVLWIFKKIAKDGLTPTQWLEKYFGHHKYADSDRATHEMRVLAQVFEYAVSYDQINVASLASFEILAWRWQLLLTAHEANPFVAGLRWLRVLRPARGQQGRSGATVAAYGGEADEGRCGGADPALEGAGVTDDGPCAAARQGRRIGAARVISYLSL